VQHMENKTPFSYEVKCELSRMSKVMTAITQEEGIARPTRWIRYNPDACKVDGKTTYISKEVRHAKLLSAILTPPTDTLFDVNYLF
jgi:hypothetical protein